MFDLLSLLIHIINSVFSGFYTSQFLKSKQKKKVTVLLWSVIYFMVQIVIFDLIQSQYPFGNVAGTIINMLLILGMQLVFFRREPSRQIFVSFSFVAGKEIVKYVASVFNYALGMPIGNWINRLVMQGKIVTTNQVEAVNNMMISILSFATSILYAAILGSYLILINKKYVRKEYQLQMRENIFLILPSIAAICISITLRMMIITVENGTMGFIFDTVPVTLFWVPVICILLLGTVIANVILFQNLVNYHEENRMRTLLEN